MRQTLKILAVLWAIPIFGGPALAQSSGGEMRQLLDELKVKLDHAQKNRLADPWFLRDLQDIVSKYDNPWRKRLLNDDFSARGPNPAPPWKVTAGEFLIDWRHGLRSVVKAKPAQQQATQKKGNNDPTADLIGSLLEQALGGKKSGKKNSGSGQAQKPANPGFAAVTAPIAISNAFSIKFDLSTRPVAGTANYRFELGPYQGADASSGYRLVYSPNDKPYLVLRRLSSRGSSTLESYDKAITLGDGKVHALAWTRTTAGAMKVSLDGKVLMSVTDQSFKDPFVGFAMVNAGGDYALRQVQIDGTN